ncbi:hypothetical protein BDV11DRAFT_196939 [Aspergillus similis]
MYCGRSLATKKRCSWRPPRKGLRRCLAPYAVAWANAQQMSSIRTGSRWGGIGVRAQGLEGSWLLQHTQSGQI